MSDAFNNTCDVRWTLVTRLFHMLLCPAAGLEGGVKLLKGIADKHDDISYADIFQLASAIAVKV